MGKLATRRQTHAPSARKVSCLLPLRREKPPFRMSPGYAKCGNFRATHLLPPGCIDEAFFGSLSFTDGLLFQ